MLQYNCGGSFVKNKIKKHWLIMLVLVLSLWAVFFACFQYWSNQKKLENLETEWISYCQSDHVADGDIEACNHSLKEYNQKIEVDFYSMMTDLLIYKLRFFNVLAFLMLVVPTLISLCHFMKNKYVVSFCSRDSYKSFLKMYFKEAYRYIWLLPVIAGFLILMCMINTTFDPSYAMKYGSSMWKTGIIYHPILFIILYLTNMFLYSCFFVNFALIIVRKHHNYIKAIILSFITYIGLELFLEVVANALILQTVFHTDIGQIFNIMNLFTFSDSFGIPLLMGFTFFMLILSIIGVYFSYRNKEKLIIDCEKNNNE